jgi:hypothetical protein
MKFTDKIGGNAHLQHPSIEHQGAAMQQQLRIFSIVKVCTEVTGLFD